MSILGIDPGLTGGIILIDSNGTMQCQHVMPSVSNLLDTAALSLIFANLKPVTNHCFIEAVNAFPGQGVSSSLKFGRVYGIAEGIIAALKIPYTLVSPIAWQKEIHAGVERKLDPKERSRIATSRLFPGLDLRATEHCRKPHDGLVDALLIAEFGRRSMVGAAPRMESGVLGLM